MKYLLPLLFLCLLLNAACNNSSTTPTSSSAVKDSAGPADAHKPRLFMSLPEAVNTPDGMTLNAAGDILLSAPNFNKPDVQPRIYRISGDSLVPFTDLPLRSDTHHVGPMDLAFGPDGNLYVNDNQYELYDKAYKSRVLRVRVKDGRATGVEVVVDGLRLANGMVWKGADLYITDSQWDLPGDTAKSAVFHFTLAELGSGKVIHPAPGFTDRHILDTFTTQIGPDKIDNGADGIDYDSKGALYTGLFGSGAIYKMYLKPDGSLDHKELFVPAGGIIQSVDGFIIDRRTDKLYIADAKKNAIRVVSPAGAATTLWENGDTDGRDGSLDQPAEVLLRGDTLIIASFDKPNAGDFTNKGFDAPYTLSAIRLR